jgi:hypothetical protein
MAGLNYFRVYYNNVSVNIDDLFGFFYCKIKCKYGYLGLLPYKEVLL